MEENLIMKIEIYKKANDENVYFSYLDEKDIVLNFDNLKNLSQLFLEKKKKEEDLSYEVSAATELALYKSTVEDVLNEICNDEDLFQLYKDIAVEKQ